jgi:hypothetical protein
MKTTKLSLKFLSILILMGLILSFSSCHKDCMCNNSVNAELKNLTGLDGCGWVIVLNNGDKLEPTNLSSFNVPLVDGKKVTVAYHETQGASICMVGKMVEIESMCER